jgi:hypothetical protein
VCKIASRIKTKEGIPLLGVLVVLLFSLTALILGTAPRVFVFSAGTVVQTCTNTGSSISSISCSFSQSVTAGDFIGVAISVGNVESSFSCSDNLGQNFNSLAGAPPTSNGGTAAFYYSWAPSTGSDTVSCSWSGGATNALINLVEVSGARAQRIQTGFNTGTGTAVALPAGFFSSGTITFSICVVYANNPSSYTAGSGYTLRGTSSVGAEEDTVSTTSTCSMTLGSSVAWAEVGLLFGTPSGGIATQGAFGTSVSKNYGSSQGIMSPQDIVIVCAANNNTQSPTPTISDTLGTSWSLVAQNSNSAWAGCWSGSPPTSGADTVTVSGNSGDWTLGIHACQGFGPGNVGILYSTGSGTGTSYSVSPSITFSSTPNACATAVVSGVKTLGTVTPGSGWTLQTNRAVESFIEQSSGYASGNSPTSCTGSGTSSTTWSEVCVLVPQEAIQVTLTSLVGGFGSSVSSSNFFSLSGGGVDSSTWEVVGKTSVFQAYASTTVSVSSTSSASTNTHQWAFSDTSSQVSWNVGQCGCLTQSQTLTYYEQYSPILQISALAQPNFDNGLTLSFSGTQLGVANTPICGITTTNTQSVASCTGWIDVSTSTTFAQFLGNSPVGSQWQDASASSTTVSINSAGVYNVNYYKQLLETVSLSYPGGSILSYPSLSITQLGTPNIVLLSASPQSYYFDYGSAWQVSPTFQGQSFDESYTLQIPNTGTWLSSQTTVFPYGCCVATIPLNTGLQDITTNVWFHASQQNTYGFWANTIWTNLVLTYPNHIEFVDASLASPNNPSETFGLGTIGGNFTITQINQPGPTAVVVQSIAQSGKIVNTTFYYPAYEPAPTFVQVNNLPVMGQTNFMTNYQTWSSTPGNNVYWNQTGDYIIVKTTYSNPTLTFGVAQLVAVTITLNLGNPGSEPLISPNYFQLSYSQLGTQYTAHIDDGSFFLYADPNSAISILGADQVNSGLRYCLPGCGTTSANVGSGASASFVYDYWVQTNITMNWVKIDNDPFANENPLVYYESFGVNTSSPIYTYFSTYWMDNGSSWSVQNPFYYNMRLWTPVPASGFVSGPATYTITFPLNLRVTAVGCSPLPPTLLLQLMQGCSIPAILSVYSGVIGLQWFLGFIVMLVAGMLYLKTENTWLPLIVMIAATPVIGFLIPSQVSGLVYLFVVIAIAGVLYLGFKARGT